jgi:hypothetical protein
LLDEDGRVWIYNAGADPMIAECPDCLEKLCEIRAAAKHWAELADWLPTRPLDEDFRPKPSGLP